MIPSDKIVAQVSDVAHGPLVKLRSNPQQNSHDIHLITGRCLHWLGSLRPDWLSGSVCWGTGLDRLHKSVQLLLSTVRSHHVMSIGLLSPCQIWRKVIYKKILNLHHNFHFCLGHLNPKFHISIFYYHCDRWNYF